MEGPKMNKVMSKHHNYSPNTHICSDTKRHEDITRLVKESKFTLEAIGTFYGITRERVRQIAAMHGYSRRRKDLQHSGTKSA